MNEDSDCPECGAHVWRSLLNNDIEHCYPGWTRILVRGLSFAIVGILIEIVATIVMYVSRVVLYADLPYENIISLVLSLPLLAGMWLFTVPDQGLPASSDRARRVARYLALGSYLLMILEVVMGSALPWVRFGVSCSRIMLFLLAIVLMLHYLREFSVRLSRPRLRWQCTFLKWAFVFQLAYWIAYIPLVITVYNSANYTWFTYIDQWYCGYTLLYPGLMIWTLIIVVLFRRVFARTMRYAQWDWANKADFSQAYRDRRRASYLKK